MGIGMRLVNRPVVGGSAPWDQGADVDEGELKNAVNDGEHDLFDSVSIHESQDSSDDYDNSDKRFKPSHGAKYEALIAES